MVRWQGSGDLMAVSRSNCYIVVPPDRERFAAGEAITVLFLTRVYVLVRYTLSTECLGAPFYLLAA